MKLDIQKFAVSKSTTFSESNLDPSLNTSSLTITIYFSANNTATYFTNEPLYCTCNGVTQSARVTHSKGGSVTKSFTFNNIEHESDGSKSVSWSWYCNTGTSVLGNIRDSGTKQLTTLHTPPLIDSYTITEINQDLINAGISDNVFVANLSKKNINIVYYLFDNATLQRASVYNTTNQNYLNPTLPVLMDLTQYPLYTTEDGVPIYVRITDSLDGATYFTNNGVIDGRINPDFYNFIPYTKISLTNSSTIAKRIGQISGRVGLTINGNFYNGIVGNIDQTSYKPTIKYKYWKYGDNEPTTYDYTIPSNEITISNDTFEVSNYDIGSTIETDTNYFDPEYAWRIKLYVEDNFTNVESNELQIQVGEAVWTEYINRVDFKRITIKNEIDIYDEMFYKSGDVIELGSNDGGTAFTINGFVSDSTRQLLVSIPVAKRLDNITTITPVSINVETRGNSGYLNNTGGYIEYVEKSGYTIYLDKSSENTIRLRIAKSTAWSNVTNNTPISINGYIKFTLT